MQIAVTVPDDSVTCSIASLQTGQVENVDR